MGSHEVVCHRPHVSGPHSMNKSLGDIKNVKTSVHQCASEVVI